MATHDFSGWSNFGSDPRRLRPEVSVSILDHRDTLLIHPGQNCGHALLERLDIKPRHAAP